MNYHDRDWTRSILMFKDDETSVSRASELLKDKRLGSEGRRMLVFFYAWRTLQNIRDYRINSLTHIPLLLNTTHISCFYTHQNYSYPSLKEGPSRPI